MKFDTIRAWKDETYRQSLSDEQINTLPANPAGELELSNAEMESINGGFGPSEFGQSGSSASRAEERDFQSLALRCNRQIFSITTVHQFGVLSPVVPICINDED